MLNKYVFILLQFISHSYSFSLTPHENILNELTLYFASLVNISITNTNISSSCKELLTDYYINGTNSWYYLHKLFYDSSHNQGDTNSFDACKRKTHGITINTTNIEELSYLMLLVDKRNTNSTIMTILTDTLLYYYGLCMPKKMCSDNDTIYIIDSTLEKIDLGFDAKLSNYALFHLDKYTFKPIHLVYLIPVYLILLQIVFMLWNNVLIRMGGIVYKYCCYTKKQNDNDLLNTMDVLNKKKRINSKKIRKFINEVIKKSFNVIINAEELFSIKKVSDVHNDIGITYIKGIRSIAMLFLLIGNVFVNIFNSPMCIKNQELLYNILGNPFYFMVIVGIKYSPKVLLSCSGFELLYKLLCYLDDRTDDERKRNITIHTDSTKKDISSSYSNSDDKSQGSSESIDSSIKTKNKSKVKELVHLNLFCNFLCYQLHKYVMYIFVLSFIYFSLFYVVYLLNDIKPLWIYFQEKIITSNTLIETIISYICIRNIFVETGKEDSIINAFSLVMNEILFFIISSFIIYISYKHSFLLNRILLIIIGLLFISHNIFYFMKQPQYNATNYFTYSYYGLYSTFPVNNYIYYTIGMFFSLINYSFQKGLNYKLADKQEKPYLLSTIKFIKILKKLNPKKLQMIIWISFIVIVLLPFVQFAILNEINYDQIDDILKSFFYNKLYGCLLMYDCDLYVVLIHLFCFMSYMQGNNFIISFLSGKIWNIFNKLYYSYILNINWLILYVLYQSETRISLTIQYVLFYSTVCGFIVFIVCSGVYVFVELPFKKVIYMSINYETKINDLINRRNSSQTDSSMYSDKYISEESFRLFNQITEQE